MTLAEQPGQPDECYRCGYALLGIADDHACPECGLLAERSRRPSDELHNTRPRWLRSMSLGIMLIILAIVLLVLGAFVSEDLLLGNYYWLEEWLAVDLMILPLIGGVLLLTRPEGYAPADLADRKFRWVLRCWAFVPLLAIVLLQSVEYRLFRRGFSSYGSFFAMRAAGWILVTVGAAPLPLLLFIRLRSVAKRARSAHLAEHCLIVGTLACAALVYVGLLSFVFEYADQIGLPDNWTGRSNVALLMMLLLALGAILSILWSLYLLVRFAIAFLVASQTLRQHWRRDDRAAEPVANLPKV